MGLCTSSDLNVNNLKWFFPLIWPISFLRNFTHIGEYSQISITFYQYIFWNLEKRSMGQHGVKCLQSSFLVWCELDNSKLKLCWKVSNSKANGFLQILMCSKHQLINLADCRLETPLSCLLLPQLITSHF